MTSLKTDMGKMSLSELLVQLLGIRPDFEVVFENPQMARDFVHLFQLYTSFINGPESILRACKKFALPTSAQNSILCLWEMARRLAGRWPHSGRIVLNEPAKVHQLFRHLALEEEEIMVALFLNHRHEFLTAREIARGQYNAVLCTASDVLTHALRANSRHIVIIHNHPSGNCDPSEEDIKFTKKMEKACDLLDTILIDHLVFSLDDYYSFKESGLIL